MKEILLSMEDNAETPFRLYGSFDVTKSTIDHAQLRKAGKKVALGVAAIGAVAGGLTACGGETNVSAENFAAKVPLTQEGPNVILTEMAQKGNPKSQKYDVGIGGEEVAKEQLGEALTEEADKKGGPTEVQQEPTMSDFLKSYLATPVPKEPTDIISDPSQLPTEVPSPTPTEKSSYLEDYLAPIPTAGPTSEAKPTSELIELGTIDLLEDPRTSPVFIKIHDWIADVVGRTGELPTELSAELAAQAGGDNKAYIPQTIYRLDDDPDTKDKVEGLTAGVVFMTKQEFEQIYGVEGGLSEEELQECKQVAFDPFLKDWQNTDTWRFNPNTRRKVTVYTHETTGQHQCRYKEYKVDSKSRTFYKTLKINQPVVR